MRKIEFLFLFLVVAISFDSQAAPTITNLLVPNPNSGSNLLGDTRNDRLLWVTPPRQGDVRIKAQSLAVDEATCQAVAEINARRLSGQRIITILSDQLVSLTEYRGALMAQATNEKWGVEKMIIELNKLDEFIAKSRTNLEEAKKSAGFDPIPPVMYQSAGYYSMVADSDWASMLSEVRDAYPGYTVNGIPTSDVEVYVSVLDAGAFKPTELIANVNVGNFADLTSVVEGIQVDIEPTKVGACFVRFPQIMRGEAKPYAFGMSMTYTYSQSITSKVHATYNLSDIYNYVMRSGKSGGFFSSKSWREVTESHDVNELFQLEVSFERPATPEEIEAERTRVKEYLLGYAISDMVAQSGQVGPPGKSGAAIASEALTKSCGVNVYCQGAAVGLAILDGIFGTSATQETISKTLNVTRVYDSSVTEAIPIPAAISFTVTP